MPVLAIYENVPDRRWYGNMPELLMEKRGDGVDALIERIDQAAHSYPYATNYTIWPGPNSNTFTAGFHGLFPELELDLPPQRSVRITWYRIDSQAPSGSGFRFNFFWLNGCTGQVL